MNGQVQAAGLPGAQAASGSDDKIWAALSHGSVVLLFIGPVVPLIMWTLQRKKSPYTAFQALQAMIYQSLVFWLWITVIPLMMIVALLIALAVMVAARPDSGAQPFAILAMQFAMFGTMFGSVLLFMAVGIAGAVASLMGRDFRYPFFGSRLARFLGYEGAAGPGLAEEKEDRIIAAVSHSTCVLLFWGIVTPVVAWITQHERSAYVRFQSMQAAVYQAIGLLAYFGVMGLYVISMLGFMGMAMTLQSSSSSPSGEWVVAGMIPMLCVGTGVAVVLPLYHLFGFLGTLGTLRGKDFRYPILGNIVAAKMKPTEPQA